MNQRTTQEGGCQCGRIRYEATYDPENAYLCHCRMCQRATGGVSIAFLNLAKDNLHWKTEPEWFASSSFAKRPFCKECGTPLGFALLRFGKDTVAEPVAVSIQRFLDAFDIGKIGSYAQNHARASSISRRICRMDSPSPAKIASPMRK